MSDIRIDTLKPHYAPQLAEMQKLTLPTLGEDEWLKEEHFLNHARIFPDGNFVALAGDQVVGLGSGFLTDFDFDAPNHGFMEFIDYGYYNNHNPNGEWYYGADIGVHPDFRRRGIGNMLYQARKNVIKRLNLRGLIGGGLLPGFADHKANMDVHTYVDKVISGELYDRTLSFQLHQGFKVRALLENYLEDTASDNWATLIVWDNPDYREPVAVTMNAPKRTHHHNHF